MNNTQFNGIPPASAAEAPQSQATPSNGGPTNMAPGNTGGGDLGANSMAPGSFPPANPPIPTQPGTDQPKTTLWMGELEGWMDEAFIRQIFSHILGEAVNVKVIRDKATGYGYIWLQAYYY